MRYAFTLLSVLTLLVALAAAGSAGANRHSAKATFKFCTDPTFPPMEYTTTSGKIIGFDVDMATKLAATWGGDCCCVEDRVPGADPGAEREALRRGDQRHLRHARPLKQAAAVTYMKSHRVLIVKAGNPKSIHSPNQLKGLVVAVQTGTKYEEYLKALKAKIGFTLQGYPGDNDAVAQVLLGRADAVLTQDTSFAFQAKAHPGQDRDRLHVRRAGLVRDLLPQSRCVDARRADRRRHQAAQGRRRAGEARREVQDPGGRRLSKMLSSFTCISSGKRSPPVRTGGERLPRSSSPRLRSRLRSSIGFFVALGSLSARRWVRSISWLYNWLFRATPTLLQLYFVWDVLPSLWQDSRRAGSRRSSRHGSRCR